MRPSPTSWRAWVGYRPGRVSLGARARRLRWTGTLALLLAAAAARADGPPEPGLVTLRCGALTAELQRAHAWNLQRLACEGVEVCSPTGAYGALLCVPAAGGWVGSAHTEGGIERTDSLALTVDGEAVELTDGAVFACRQAELTKSSMLDLVRLEAAWSFADGRLRQRHALTAIEDVVVSAIYPFMFCVSAAATQWMAQGAGGEETAGEFTGEGKLAWHEGWQWTAAFMPEQRSGLLVRHTREPEGARVLTGYWDTTRHRKLYVKLTMDEEPWPEGKRVEAEVMVTCFQAPPATWQEVAREMAAGLVSG
ncbi:MAG: hypothetical protein AB7Y46_12385 [Armatimonadota bacterium]